MALITDRKIREAAQESGGPVDPLVKPLAWYRDDEDDWRADTEIGDYVVMHLDDGTWAAESWHGPTKRGDTIRIGRDKDPELCKRLCDGFHKLLVGTLLSV